MAIQHKRNSTTYTVFNKLFIHDQGRNVREGHKGHVTFQALGGGVTGGEGLGLRHRKPAKCFDT